MGGLGEGGGGVKNFFTHHNELLILAYNENLVKFRFMVNSGQQGTAGEGT